MTIYIIQRESVEVIAFCLVINDELHRLKRKLPPKIEFYMKSLRGIHWTMGPLFFLHNWQMYSQ